MLTYLLKNRSVFWQGKYFDLWTIPHTLSGFLIAYVFVRMEWNTLVGFFVALGLAILWEFFETKTGLSKKEPHLNGLGDVVVAQIGFIAGLYIFQTQVNDTSIAAISFFMFSIVTVLGWTSHRFYAK